MEPDSGARLGAVHAMARGFIDASTGARPG
jgi:hypothetical protein